MFLSYWRVLLWIGIGFFILDFIGGVFEFFLFTNWKSFVNGNNEDHMQSGQKSLEIWSCYVVYLYTLSQTGPGFCFQREDCSFTVGEGMEEEEVAAATVAAATVAEVVMGTPRMGNFSLQLCHKETFQTKMMQMSSTT